MSKYSIFKEAIVTHSAEEMYLLVNDLASYPEFVPWCHLGEVLSEREGEMLGKLGFSSLGQSYTLITRNTLEYGKTITLQLEEGPLSFLEGEWRFEGVPDGGCKVSLTLHFQPSNQVFAQVFSAFFHRVSSELVATFVRRAQEVYGRNKLT